MYITGFTVPLEKIKTTRMKHIKIGLFIALCLVQSSYAQVAQKSEIIISEEHLISLISKIRQKRDSLYAVNLAKKTALQHSKQTNQLVTSTNYSTNNSNYDLVLSRMATLDSKLDKLTTLLEKQFRNQPNTTTAKPTNYQDAKLQNDNNAYLLSKIVALEQEVSDLKKTAMQSEGVSRKSRVSPTVTNNYYTQPKEIQEVVVTKEIVVTKEVHDTIAVEKKKLLNFDASVPATFQDSVAVQKKKLTDYKGLTAQELKAVSAPVKKPVEDDLFKKYSGLKHQVLFENNSAEVNSSYFEILDQLVILCSENPKMDVLLKGFSSKIGKPAYNQKLSLIRTETVKNYLIEKGLDSGRIFSQYHGVDHSSKTEDFARRVTISFLIRR